MLAAKFLHVDIDRLSGFGSMSSAGSSIVSIEILMLIMEECECASLTFCDHEFVLPRAQACNTKITLGVSMRPSIATDTVRRMR